MLRQCTASLQIARMQWFRGLRLSFIIASLDRLLDFKISFERPFFLDALVGRTLPAE